MLSLTPYWPATSSLPPSRSCSSGTLVDDIPYLPPRDALVSPDQLPTLVSGKITQPIINYLVGRVCDAVDFGLSSPSSSSKHTRTSSHRDKAGAERSAFTEFVATVLRRAEVTLSVVIGALVYIDRAQPHLSIAIEKWAHHRVFLGALIVASKYLNDASLKNAHWALCTGVFGRRDVQRIEREFLDVLAWELAVSEADLVKTCSRMVREGALICTNVKLVDPFSSPVGVQMDVDGHATRKRSLSGSLRTVRALWDEVARREQVQVQSTHRSEKKRGQADVDMDVDDCEARARRRKSAYASPKSSDTCSTCAIYSSPATDSDDSVSPCTPPPPHQPLPSFGKQYAAPGYTVKSHPHPNLMQMKSASSGGMRYPPLTLLDAFPSVPPAPLPTPTISPVQAPAAPPPLPSLPPYPAFPLSRAFPASHPHLRPHSARPASPYAKPSLSTGTMRSMTPYSHKRSSAMSMVPSLYPSYIPVANAA